ncbi:MAG: Holliday junction branch migration protein RuvA [Patescibacteria group bacterium]|jgi:Holliday junction DNA helicase RuvA
MISYLKGKILAKGQGFVILEVNDVGYKIHVSPPIYAEMKNGGLMEFYIHEHVREDCLDLYGFKTFGEVEFFELLLSISGVGPKSALGVISIASPEEVKESICHGDPHLLTKVSGIGKKTAERIVLELRDKIAYLPAGNKQEAGAKADEIDALLALGYSLGQAREALKQVDTGIKESGERIRQALKKLGK